MFWYDPFRKIIYKFFLTVYKVLPKTTTVLTSYIHSFFFPFFYDKMSGDFFSILWTWFPTHRIVPIQYIKFSHMSYPFIGIASKYTKFINLSRIFICSSVDITVEKTVRSNFSIFILFDYILLLFLHFL